MISLHTIISMLMRGVEKTRGDVFRDHSREHGEAGSVKFVRLASSLGRVIEAEVNLSRLQTREKVIVGAIPRRIDQHGRYRGNV